MCPCRQGGERVEAGHVLQAGEVGEPPICTACPAFGVCTPNTRGGRQLQIRPHEPAVRRHRLWMETEEAQQAYRRRLPLFEPLFGILKTQMGAWRFTLRGLAEVEAEWTLLATAFNLRTLWRLWRGRTPVSWTPDPVPGPAS